jgi:hypothetical protein
MKTIEQYFIDWESDVFGYGYGTGEEPVLLALKNFLLLCCNGPYQHAYNYDELEKALTPTVAWLLINTLCHANILDYGTSPRYAWLTPQGEALKKFVSERTAVQLAELPSPGGDYIHCMPDHCNCDDGDCRTGNPFWKKRP